MFFPRRELSVREEGLIIVVPLLSLMLAAVVAFLLIDPLREFSEEHTSVWAALPETIAVAVFVAGAESALLILLPLKYNDGEKVWTWNRLIWVGLALPALFMFFHALVNEEELGDLINESETLTLMIIALVVLAVAVATWLFFRRREARSAGSEDASEHA
jgi:hypothetical protein